MTRRLIFAFLLLITIATREARGQTTATGSLHGAVVDANDAILQGASVSASSDSSPKIFTAISDSRGQYRLEALPPGRYTIIARREGFSQFRLTPVTVQDGVNGTCDIKMALGSISETIDVVQEAPLLESRNAVQAVNISGELARSMPLSERREWFGALALAPGVTSSESASNEKLLYVHGADFSANIVQIDGADVTPTLASTLRYVSLNTDAIDDLQIKTAGVDASAPLGFGGIISIATANGTNQLKGAATLSFQPRAWNGSNNPGGTSSTVDQRQVDLSLGGPLVENHLWGFGAYRDLDITNGVSRTPMQLDALNALVPGFVAVDNTNTAHFLFAKLTAQLSSRQELTGFYQYDRNPISIVTDAVTASPHTESTGGSGSSVRLSSIWSDTLTTRFNISYNDKRREVPAVQANEPLQRIYQSTLPSGGLLVGNGRLVDLGAPLTGASTQLDSKLTMSFDGNLFLGAGVGSHEIQAGFYGQPRINVGLRDDYPNGGFVFEEDVLRQPGNFSSGVIPFHRVIIDGITNLRLDRRGQDYAVYVQDAWRPVPRLTISPGIRLDRVVWTDQLFGVTTERSLAVGPRLGVNYAITSDTKTVLRGHWVRVHDQPATTGTSVGTATLGQHNLYDLNLDGTFETSLFTPPTFGVSPSMSVDPNFHQPHVNEWGAGLDKQLRGRVTTSVDLVHREFRDRPTLLEVNGRYAGNVFAGYLNEAFNQIYQATNNRWNWPVYTSLELSVSKRTPRFQTVASYVRQWQHIAGSWQPNDPAAFIQPNAFPNDHGIGSSTGSTGSPTDANSLSGTQMTQFGTTSSQWQNHVIRAGMSYEGPWHVLVGLNYTFQSGAWSGPIITNAAAPDPAFGPATVTLSNGRRVANPLATTFRFAYPTRGDGQLTTPPLHVFNARAGRRFSWRKYTFDAAVDVFNLTNNGADYSFQFGANQTFNPSFGTTTYRQLPRSAQLVLRLSL
ncbi:MAG TPA: TonB-dependent receptor [Vicinamibacterales bacterium]|nr:TonB-dependent receptor [Vicinamibacterales bacterium]